MNFIFFKLGLKRCRRKQILSRTFPVGTPSKRSLQDTVEDMTPLVSLAHSLTLLVAVSALLTVNASPASFLDTQPSPSSCSRFASRRSGIDLDCAAFDPSWYFDFETESCTFTLGCEGPNRFDTEEECRINCAAFIAASN